MQHFLKGKKENNQHFESAALTEIWKFLESLEQCEYLAMLAPCSCKATVDSTTVVTVLPETMPIINSQREN